MYEDNSVGKRSSLYQTSSLIRMSKHFHRSSSVHPFSLTLTHPVKPDLTQPHSLTLPYPRQVTKHSHSPYSKFPDLILDHPPSSLPTFSSSLSSSIQSSSSSSSSPRPSPPPPPKRISSCKILQQATNLHAASQAFKMASQNFNEVEEPLAVPTSNQSPSSTISPTSTDNPSLIMTFRSKIVQKNNNITARKGVNSSQILLSNPVDQFSSVSSQTSSMSSNTIQKSSQVTASSDLDASSTEPSVVPCAASATASSQISRCSTASSPSVSPMTTSSATSSLTSDLLPGPNSPASNLASSRASLLRKRRNHLRASRSEAALQTPFLGKPS